MPENGLDLIEQIGERYYPGGGVGGVEHAELHARDTYRITLLENETVDAELEGIVPVGCVGDM